GIDTAFIFDIENFARVWKARGLVELAEIAPGNEVQLNLTWSQGWGHKEYSVSDIWLDAESRDFATELQRRRHVRFQQHRWGPGWIDQVENYDYGGGMVTLTLFGGMDPSRYADLRETQTERVGVTPAEETLRTWYHRGDKKIGKVMEWK